MAESTVPKVKRDINSIILYDNAAAHSYTLQKVQGDLNYSIPGPVVTLILDNGEMGATPTLRFGDDQPCTWGCTLVWLDATDAAVATLQDILNGMSTGFVGSTWVSTLGANAEVGTVQAVMTFEGSDHGDGADHTMTFNHNYITGTVQWGDPTIVTLAATSYDVYPTPT